MADKSQQMIAVLKPYPENFGFALLGTAVVIVGPGAPFSVYPTWFGTADLQKAIDAGLLRKRQLTGSFELEVYAIKQN